MIDAFLRVEMPEGDGVNPVRFFEVDLNPLLAVAKFDEIALIGGS